MTTDILKRASEEVVKSPEAEQRAFAAWILDELVSEQRWAKLLQDSQEVLS
jgi:hypothetical protein